MKIEWDIRQMESLDSSNLEMQRLIVSEDCREGLLVRAGYQTGGRGYQDNQWESEAGKNLLFSFLLRPDFLSPSKNFLISVITSLSLHDVVVNQCDNTFIKWPNDLLVGEEKIAGILIENSILGNRIEHAVVGVGVNVNQHRFQSYSPPATSMSLQKGCQFGIHSLLEDFLAHFEHWYGKLVHGDDQSVMKVYLERLYHIGKQAAYRADGIDFMGKITGVAMSGEMEMTLPGGDVRHFAFKELEYLDL